MFLKLALLLTLVPILELFVLIPLAGQIGVWPTVAIVILTGVAGAWLAKRQGMQALRRIRKELGGGQLPGDAVLDGVLILMACTLLVTPGVLTDAVGIALLVPAVRRPLKGLLKRRFTKMLQNPDVTVIDVRSFGAQIDRRATDDDVIDITPSNERRFVAVDN